MSFDFSKPSDSTTPLSYFSNRGEDYEKYRPTYPASAIEVILSGLNSPTQLVAADIGAGTGIGARLLADRGIRVVAIEPNADMRMAATSHERVEFLAGTAEQIPLEAGSVDLVTSFQAFHWFDFANSLQEFRRILKPGGRLALLWNLWQPSDPVSKEYTRSVFAASSDRERQSAPQTQATTWLRSLRYQLFWHGVWLPYFTNFRRQEFTFNQQLDLAGLIGLARSQGFTPNEGTALEKMVAELSNFHLRFSDDRGQVRLVYCTRLYLATSASDR